jgi:vacuolar-type H+-ATPase catalytic subunit A/Vma1
MKTATVTQLKKELVHHSQKELIELCLRLSKFKKENKELLTYLLFEESNENDFILGVKDEIEFQFTQINTSSYYFMKKSIRKILRMTKKFIRYSKKKETEISLLIYFCSELKNIRPTMSKNVSLQNIFDRQIVLIEKALLTLHEDLQFDYKMELEEILDN